MPIGSLIWDEGCPRCGERIRPFEDQLEDDKKIRRCRNCDLRVRTAAKPGSVDRDILYVMIYSVLLFFSSKLIGAFITPIFLGLSCYRIFHWEAT